MPDYDFSGLSPRAFEHMVQALSCKIFGPGLVAFGDGPDGGREATFTGRTTQTIPPGGEPWDGYVVIQAKFRQRPVGRALEDGKWAIDELKKELNAFADRGTKRKLPEYYVFVTNVVLSPMQTQGAKDKVRNLISDCRGLLGLKDFLVWDFDQLCRFLDADQSVRNAYRAWTTPGDVLANLASAIESKNPEFKKVMVNYLQKELLDDHYSKLEQAGHGPENRVPLERVFVDLPVFAERRPKAPEEGAEGKELPPGFLVAALRASARCLKVDTGQSLSVDPSRPEHQKAPEPGRIVLIGGPGQGKSTLAQFLCQIHRAQLLRNAPNLDADARLATDSIITQCGNQDIPVNLAKRFPIRIELARFAKALATESNGRGLSVLAYLSDRIKERTDYGVSVDHLRAWLQAYPWLVILDGLDEVPASSNREQVIAATKDFLVDIASNDADVFLITTTRPQGYNAEFTPQRHKNLWLAPLSIPRALFYGRTLVESTYQHDSMRKAEVLNRLNDAARVDATARLMESPLQVTIMARLLAQIAKPPQERYRLFQQYYKVIYRREIERGVPYLSQLLRDYESDIDAIHYRTGLLLQIESERTQHTDATLSVDEFKRIVQHRLDKEGHPEDARLRMTEEIVRCATERLVFLVPTQSERVGFEIRSLQEFMASEALMDGEDRVVTSRIRKIAAVPFWQNVLLFAAGKCFAERQWLRDGVSEICAEMNDNPIDDLGHAVLAGSHLAVSLLEDGPARRQPAYSQSLARRALELLSLPPNDAHDRLADVYEPAFKDVYMEELQRCMGSRHVMKQLGAWRVLLRLLDRGSAPWARNFAETHWPAKLEEQQQILGEIDPMESDWLWEKYQRIFFELPIMTDWLKFRRIKEGRPDYARSFVNKSAKAAFALEAPWWHDREMEVHYLYTTPRFKISAGIVGVEAGSQRLAACQGPEPVHQHWAPLTEAARFAANPTKLTLADALERIGEFKPVDSWPRYIRRLPWPLAACILAARDADSLRALAQRARAGGLGDFADWAAAERRWSDSGVCSKDLVHMTDDKWPIGDDIAKKGFPIACGIFGWEGEAGGSKELRQFWSQIRGPQARALCAPVVLNFFYRFRPPRKRSSRKSAEEERRFLGEVIGAMSAPAFIPFELLLIIQEMWTDARTKIGILENLGMKAGGMSHFGHGAYSTFLKPEPGTALLLIEFLIKEIEKDASRCGVLNLLTLLSAEGQIRRVPSNLALLRGSRNERTSFGGFMLSLCRGGSIGRDSGKLLDDLIKKWYSDEVSLGKFLNCSIAQFGNQPDAADFFLHFWKGIGDGNLEVKKGILRVLLDLLGRRVTGLQGQGAWVELSLPDGLYQVIAQPQR